MSRKQHRGFTLTDLLVIMGVLAVVILLVLMLLPSSGSRELPKRSACAANLRSLGTGLHTYANLNGDSLPVELFPAAETEGIGRVTYAPKKIGLNRTRPTAPEDVDISVTRSLWTMIREGDFASGSFICPVSEDSRNDEDNPQDFWDFAKYSETSYGYQVPFGKSGQPKISRGTSDTPIAADKGPYVAALEAGLPYPGVPPVTSKSSPDEWRRWNSPNHGGAGDGEGQNVLYTDAHADWNSKPTAGVQYDNIYTRWSDASGGTQNDERPRVWGTPPTSNETPFGDTDTLLYP